MLFIDYLPAELKANKNDWYVSYYVKNPQTNKLHRKRIRVNRIKSLTERKKIAKKLILDINNKLQTGWNPFLEQEAPKGYTKLIAALNTYLKAKQKELDSEDSKRTYKSHVEILINYIETVIKEPDLFVISFDGKYANNYMDFIYNKNIGNRTFNNYKTFLISFWNWFIEKQYCKVNPFKTVSKKKEQKKKRQIIDIETRTKIKNYLLKNNQKEFLAMVMLCYHGLIRPKEICLLKPEYFKLKDKLIILPPEITKDDDTRIISISNDLMQYLECLEIETINKELYIFSKNYKPGKILLNSRDTSREWSKMRDDLKFKKDYQFYSLKDTGIVQMLMDGISPIEVRNQAGHSSLEQTNEYAIYANPKGSEDIKNKGVKF